MRSQRALVCRVTSGKQEKGKRSRVKKQPWEMLLKERSSSTGVVGWETKSMIQNPLWLIFHWRMMTRSLLWYPMITGWLTKSVTTGNHSWFFLHVGIVNYENMIVEKYHNISRLNWRLTFALWFSFFPINAVRVGTWLFESFLFSRAKAKDTRISWHEATSAMQLTSSCPFPGSHLSDDKIKAAVSSSSSEQNL